MENIEQLHSDSTLQTYIVHQNKTVLQILRELNLENKFFAVLINGKTAKLTDIVKKDSEIVILPKLAGGY